MPVPEDIRKVSRPKNTVVRPYGKNKDRYVVIERVGCERKNGGNHPKDGKTIGHIIDHKYVPLKMRPVYSSNVDLKDWADIILCDKLFKDILEDLYRFYDIDDALKIYCMAILRVTYKGVCDSGLKEAYEDSFLSEIYPGVALSKNTVSRFENMLGKMTSKIIGFMRDRVEKISLDDHLLIDGTLKSDGSSINSLSDFSRKARIKNYKDISIIYAYSLEKREPICSKCYPGNMLDCTAYENFISENHITKGLIIDDKGFPYTSAKKEIDTHPDLHYLTPLRRNAKLANIEGIHDYSGILENTDGILYKKITLASDHYLYSYRDNHRAYKEESDYLKDRHKDGDYDDDAFKVKKELFGTIVLESDLDMEPKDAYQAFSSRWEIELVIRYYKTACGFRDTRVHDDYSVIGSEFIDFLSSLLTARLINTFDHHKLLDKYTYKKVMSILKRAKKIKTSDNEDFKLIKINPSYEKILIELGLLPDPEKTKRRRGRPKKSEYQNI